jgi:hypothetical protein
MKNLFLPYKAQLSRSKHLQARVSENGKQLNKRKRKKKAPGTTKQNKGKDFDFDFTEEGYKLALF